MTWDSAGYFMKAQTYAGRAFENHGEDWECPLWACLALEFLARSALTSVHPTLNADPQHEGRHLLFALGYDIKGQPRSIPFHAVLARLEQVLPEFNKPHREFCDFFVIQRNRELHTADAAFAALDESKWLAPFYRVCKVLCDAVGQSLDDLLGDERQATAEQLIAAFEMNKRQDVEQRIADHRREFEARPEDEQEALKEAQARAARVWIETHSVAECPSCSADARVTGALESTSPVQFEDGELFETETYLANRFDCGSCDLVLKDVEELLIAGVEPRFKQQVDVDLHDYFEPEEYEEYNNM